MPVLFLFAWVCAAQTGTVSGVVTDGATHLPLEGAAVRANGSIIRTGFDGSYALNVAPSPAVRVEASRTGYFAAASGAALVNVSTGETVVHNFELRPLLKIFGVVEDYDTGERIRGCHVFAMRRIYALGRAWHLPAGLITADTRTGEFAVRNLEPGDYVLEIVPEEAAPVTTPDAKPAASHKFHGWSYYPDVSRIEMAAPITVTDAGDVPVTIRLHRREPRSISGVVTAPALLELVRYAGEETRNVAGMRFAKAQAFRIGDLPEGEYRLVASTADGRHADIPLSLGDRDITDLRVAPVPDRTITGTVRMDDASAPLPSGLRFGITPLHPVRLTGTEKLVDVTDGRFRIVTDTDEFESRITGVPQGYMAEAGPDGFDYTIARTGRLTGVNLNEGDYVLLPGGATLTAGFTIDLAPGKYQIAKLEGDEPKLVRNKEFLKAKAAQALKVVEIKSGETTVFQP